MATAERPDDGPDDRLVAQPEDRPAKGRKDGAVAARRGAGQPGGKQTAATRIPNAVALAERCFQRKVRGYAEPGGRGRRSFRLIFEDGQSLIATRRRSVKRADLEVLVLRALRQQGAPVPAVLAYLEGWLFQQDLSGPRLSQVLARAPQDRVRYCLAPALESLVKIRQAADRADLNRQVAVLGSRRRWLQRFIMTPAALPLQRLPAPPQLEVAEIAARLAVGPPRFIKWDARPGNAIMVEDGSVHWVDWENCGCRNPLDDVAWMLADEFMPDEPTGEAYLLNHFLPRIEPEMRPSDALAYLQLYGVFHTAVRLRLILQLKGQGEWWDPALCLARDKVGVTLDQAQLLCLRGARWAESHPLSAPLARWYRQTAQALSAL